jgi:hypothetical protein
MDFVGVQCSGLMLLSAFFPPLWFCKYVFYGNGKAWKQIATFQRLATPLRISKRQKLRITPSSGLSATFSPFEGEKGL